MGMITPMLAKAELYFAYLGVLDFDSKLAKLKSEWKTREGYLPRIRQDGEWHVRCWRWTSPGSTSLSTCRPGNPPYGGCVCQANPPQCEEVCHQGIPG